MVDVDVEVDVFRCRRSQHLNRTSIRHQYTNTNNNNNNNNMVVIQVEEGSLRGVQKESSITGKSFCAFLGIPYAEPPIGDLRFKVGLSTIYYYEYVY